MTGMQLAKVFAWAIGVLMLLWLLAQCLGGPDETVGPDRERVEREAERYVADCRRAWDAVELLGGIDGGNAQEVADEIDLIASEIGDPALAEAAYSFSAAAQDLVAHSEPGDEERLREDYELFRSLAEADLSMRCPASVMAGE